MIPETECVALRQVNNGAAAAAAVTTEQKLSSALGKRGVAVVNDRVFSNEKERERKVI